MKTQKIIIPAIISLMLISIFSFLYSCSKGQDDNMFESKVDNHQEKSILTQPGYAHNEMLNIFYSYKYSKNGGTLQDKIDIVDRYFSDNNLPFTFSLFVDSIPEIYDFLLLMHNNTLTLEEYANLFQDIHADGWSTIEELEYQLLILDKLAEENNLDSTIIVIEGIEQMIMVDELLTILQKERMLGSLDIITSSLEYWNNEQKAMPWYMKDAMGAVYVWNSGIAAYANLLAPGWGAAGVTLGLAAVSSMIKD